MRKILRLFFFLIYQPLAFLYDGVAAAVSFGQWRSWVLSVQPLLGDGRVLELGHGPGHLQAALSGQAKQVFGLDLSRQMGRIASRRLRQQRLKPRLVRGHALFLPFQKDTFHVAVATFPSEYIFSEQTLREISRVLQPEGRLILLLAAHITGRSLLQRATGWLYRLTGQGSPPEWQLEKARLRLQEAGLIGDFEWLPVDGARLLVFRGSQAG